MRIVEIQCSTGTSRVFIGGRIELLARHTDERKAVIITDRTVRRLYEKRFPDFPVIEIGEGDKTKSLQTAEYVYGKLIEHGIDRSSFIVGIGGGVVCDIAGFAASTFMRGVRFGFVPTTLLSQADAGIGGKNGVNLGGYKNMVGVIKQPRFVLCDLGFLDTLSERELASGFAEIVKHALIRDAELFGFLESHSAGARSLDREMIERLVYDSVRIKAAVVERDDAETGERRILNFGHTFGHPLEHRYGLSHGEAVSVGMIVAAMISAQRGFLPRSDVARITRLLRDFGLPVEIAYNTDHLAGWITRDKKREGEHIHLVLLHGIGNAGIERVPMAGVEGMLHDLR